MFILKKIQADKYFVLLISIACQLCQISARAAERDTLIFISDLHMNIDAPYAWLRTNAPALAAFLNRVNHRKDVAELVILGDMLDDWVETVENPPHTFEDVLLSENNAEIMTALQAVCMNPNITVTYVAGNHDMLTFKPANKALIKSILPGLNIISDSPGLGVYTKNDVIRAEHGHRYCLFNAPDIWSRPGGNLPLGYFISRIAASKTVREGRLYTIMDALQTLVKSPASYYTPPEGDEIDFNTNFPIGLLFDAFAMAWGKYRLSSTFIMNGVDNFTQDPSMADIGGYFDDLYMNWPDQMNIVHPAAALLNDAGLLASAAFLLFDMPDDIKEQYPFTPRIVVFGHTHTPAFCYHSGLMEDSIYVNSGSWVDGSACSWVEIKITSSADGDSYAVSLWYDGESEPRYKATLDASFRAVVEPRVVNLDFDGDGVADLVLYHEESGYWYVLLSGCHSLASLQLGGPGYQPVLGDFDGDGKTDIAVYHEASGNWYALLSGRRHIMSSLKFGGPGYQPVLGDFDGDGKTDIAVYHEASGNWYALLSGSGHTMSSLEFGGPGYAPVR